MSSDDPLAGAGPGGGPGGGGGEASARWQVRRRLLFVEFRLFWEGLINRADLMDRFGISRNQATKDIGDYEAMAPGNLAYDKRARCYRRGPGFKAVLGGDDPERYLAELRQRLDAAEGVGEDWIAAPPPHAVAYTPPRRVAAETLEAVLRAIRGRRRLALTYQSFSAPGPAAREIEPHALAFDGFRWHARAFAVPDGGFRDFVLGRMTGCAVRGPRASDPADDADWVSWVTVRLAPHPDLSPGQARAIALDYGMEGGESRVRVRRALLFYTLKRLGLDTDPGARPPERQHIVLANREAVLAAAAPGPD